MKVLHVHTTYRESGGEDVVVETERQLLRDAGVDVVPIDAANPAGPAAAAAALATATWNGHAGRRVAEIAGRVDPDVVHVHNTWFALSAAVPARLSGLGLPVVMTLHNYRLVCANGLLLRDGRHCEDCVGGRTWPAIAHGCYRGSRLQSVLAAAPIALHRRAGTWVDSVDRFITLTASAHEVFLRAGLPADRLRLHHNVVTDPGPRAAPPGASTTVLFVGRLAQEKGVQLLLDAWGAAQPADLQLIVVGDGPERHRARTAPDGVRFAGRQDPATVRRLMLGARALVFPSLFAEPFGMVPVEAMAAGLPLLVSDVGDVPRLTGTRGTAQALPPGDLSSWTGAIEELATAGWLDAAGSRNRLRYERSFSPRGAADALQEVYASAIESRSARPRP